MVWDTLSTINKKKIIHIQKEVLNISDERFYPEAFSQKEAGEKIMSFLTDKYKPNTQRTYLTILAKIHPMYKDRLTFLNKAYVVTKKDNHINSISQEDYQTFVKCVDHTINNPQALIGLRVMSALLKYDLDVSLLQMIKTRLNPSNASNPSNHYDGKTWHLDNGLKVYPPAEFNRLLSNREYLVVDSKGQPYSQIQSLSKSFQTLFKKNGFTKMKTIFKNPPTKSETVKRKKVPFKLKPKFKFKPKIKLKLKLKLPKIPKSKPWEDYNDPEILPESNLTHLTKVKRLTLFLTGKDDRFYYTAFESLSAVDRIRAYLEGTHLNDKIYTFETRKNYINSLCKFISMTPEFNVTIYDKYSAYQRELKLQTICRERKKVVEFTTLLPGLTKIVQNPKLVPGFRIICSMIRNNINLADDSDNDETPGVLRMSDLKYTRFYDDGEHSFMDIKGKVLHIKSKYTKNKKARSITLPDNFITDIKQIYPDQDKLPDWLLINKSGERYDKLSSLSNMFHKWLNVNFIDIRASYTTYRHSTSNASTIGDIKTLCHNMGHSMATAQKEYVRNGLE